MLGHAVDAAQVAAVRDGDAQIADAAAKRVDHGLGVPRAGEAIGGVGVVRRDTVTVDDGDTVWCGDGLTLAGGCATERSRL